MIHILFGYEIKNLLDGKNIEGINNPETLFIFHDQDLNFNSVIEAKTFIQEFSNVCGTAINKLGSLETLFVLKETLELLCKDYQDKLVETKVSIKKTIEFKDEKIIYVDTKRGIKL